MKKNFVNFAFISVLASVVPFCTSSAAAPYYCGSNWGDAFISGMAGPWPIEIRTCAHFAGAICSLRWRDKEFIDSADHGRELQSAAVFNNHQEAFNPTEAGSRSDGSGCTSSSILHGLWATGNAVATATQMAFWLRPGEYSAAGGWAVNPSVVSNHILNKQVTIGLPGMAHVVEYRTQFNIPGDEGHGVGQFESVTGYMPPEFSQFYTYDPSSSTLTWLDDGPGEQQLPVIMATPDSGWAMGIYAPQSPYSGMSEPGYGRWRFGDTVKWNAVFRIGSPTGTYHFVSYVVVGSLQNVMVSMDQLRSSGY